MAATVVAEAETTSASEPLTAGGRPDDRAAAARFVQLFDRHGGTVLGHCRGLLRDEHEAQDAFQQTFLSAYRSLMGGVEPRHPVEAGKAAVAGNPEERGGGGASSHGGQIAGRQVRLPTAGGEDGQGQCRGPGS